MHVKEGNIFNAVRTMGDIMDNSKLYNLPGLVVTIDFKKALELSFQDLGKVQFWRILY